MLLLLSPMTSIVLSSDKSYAPMENKRKVCIKARTKTVKQQSPFLAYDIKLLGCLTKNMRME